MRVNILGECWTVQERDQSEDKELEQCDGYCDKTVRVIVISKKPEDCNLAQWDVYRKKVMRHEVIHAFLFESGLHENFEHKQFGHDETMIDWVAVQFPKMLAAFKELGCI